MGQVYLQLELRGVGMHPRLTFDREEVVLPVVPLGVSSKAVFHVVNEGYDNLELQYKLPADKSKVPLSLSFPEVQTFLLSVDFTSQSFFLSGVFAGPCTQDPSSGSDFLLQEAHELYCKD